MCRVLFAEFAILAHFEPVGVVFLVLFRVVIALFAFGTRQSDFNSHYFGTSLNYGEKLHRQCLPRFLKRRVFPAQK
jgi:hypothetical protein